MARDKETKKRISKEDWEARMSAVSVRKESLNQLVMNFLVTEGYVEAARLFEEESGTAPGADLAALTDRMEIRQALQAGRVEEAIARVNDLDSRILDEEHALAFHLQQQRLIELIRGGRTAEALAFAQEYLAPCGEEHPAHLHELERTVALLAFEDAGASPVGGLMDFAQRQRTASELNAAILKSQYQDEAPRLPTLLKMVVWAQRQLEQRADFPHLDLATGLLGPEEGAAAAPG